MRLLSIGVAAVLGLPLIAWTAGAIYVAAPLPGVLRVTISVLYTVLGLVAVLLPWRLGLSLGVAVSTVVVVVWFVAQAPSHDRDWTRDTAVLPRVSFDGTLATVEMLRDFDYRTVEDFDARYITKRFDVSKIRAMDFILSHWLPDQNIAHALLSFDFGSDDVLCLSVEARMEKTEPAYDFLRGLYNRYELIYILGTERDLVRVRTNYYKTDMYLYRTSYSPEDAQRLLRHILQRVEDLAEHPSFYNSVTQNCLTALASHVDAIWPGSMPWSTGLLLPGYLPRQVYEEGGIDTELTFEEFRARARINEAANAADSAPDFSRRIRAPLGY